MGNRKTSPHLSAIRVCPEWLENKASSRIAIFDTPPQRL
jgi:hypothetical protein